MLKNRPHKTERKRRRLLARAAASVLALVRYEKLHRRPRPKSPAELRQELPSILSGQGSVASDQKKQRVDAAHVAAKVLLFFLLSTVHSPLSTLWAATFNVTDLGGRYNDSSPAAVAGNDAAIRRAVTAGGTLLVTDPLYIGSPFVGPPLKHFVIEGNGSTGELVGVGAEGVSIGWAPRFPSGLPGADLRQGMRRIGLNNCKLVVSSTNVGAGKYFIAEGVTIYNCQASGIMFDCRDYDGGKLDVYVHECPNALGFRLVNCHATDVLLRSRVNGAGGVVAACGDLRGGLYAESNKGYGLDVDRLNRSRLAVWQEGNGTPTQGRMRNSWGNIFTGQVQDEGNQGWDIDPLSAYANTWASDPRAPAMQNIGQEIAGQKLTLINWPSEAIEIDGDTVVVHKGAFATPPPDKGYRYLKTGDRLVDFAAGDVFLFWGSIDVDDATRSYFAGLPADGEEVTPEVEQIRAGLARREALTFAVNADDEIEGRGTQNVWLSRGVNHTEWATIRQATDEGGILHPFAWLDRAAAADPSGPDRELRLTIKTSVRRIEGTTKVTKDTK